MTGWTRWLWRGVPLAAALPGALAAQDSLLARFEHLREPQVTRKADETVIEVRARGDPRIAGGRAFGLAFQLYYSIPETPKPGLLGAPRARWPVTFDTPREQWLGVYALPVPATVKALPPHQAPEGLSAALTTWEYGEVAEILHVGPYDAEGPTIERLMAFVRARGYEIAGDHEEEYLRGPTMAGPGNPVEYLTILRYRVRPREGSASNSARRRSRSAMSPARGANDLDLPAGGRTECTIEHTMPTSVHIPRHLLEAVDRKARAIGVSRNRLIVRALERELAPDAGWTAGFFNALTNVSAETTSAADALGAEIRRARRSKRPLAF
jgi:hypothetical protein